MKVGAQPIILKENLQNLNDTLKDCKGYTKNNADLKESIVAVSDGNKQKQGDYGYTKTPCTETIQFYHQILSSSSEDGIHLVKDKNGKWKDKQCQMDCQYGILPVKLFQLHMQTLYHVKQSGLNQKDCCLTVKS